MILSTYLFVVQMQFEGNRENILNHTLIQFNETFLNNKTLNFVALMLMQKRLKNMQMCNF